MKKMLGQKFFRQKTLKVARDLIGCFLCRNIGGKTLRYRIIETEAYVGPHDLSCHSSRGKTRRNSPMFDDAATIYVYFTYGMHWMLNVVTEAEGFAAAVLIRGVASGEETISGPGRLTKKLKIDGKHNGKVANAGTGLWFEAGTLGKGEKILRTARVGVAYAGEVWSAKKYRFVLSVLKPAKINARKKLI